MVKRGRGDDSSRSLRLASTLASPSGDGAVPTNKKKKKREHGGEHGGNGSGVFPTVSTAALVGEASSPKEKKKRKKEKEKRRHQDDARVSAAPGDEAAPCHKEKKERNSEGYGAVAGAAQAASARSRNLNWTVDAPVTWLGEHPFVADPGDHAETPFRAYADVAPILAKLAATIGVANESLNIYDPYYCEGSVARHLAHLGFRSVYNRNEDFYQTIADKRVMPSTAVQVARVESSRHGGCAGPGA